jgi:hypothetical protein
MREVESATKVPLNVSVTATRNGGAEPFLPAGLGREFPEGSADVQFSYVPPPLADMKSGTAGDDRLSLLQAARQDQRAQQKGTSWIPSWVRGEYERLRSLPRWQIRLRPVRGQGILKRRRRFGCQPGCMPARLASTYDDLAWKFTIAFSSAPGSFWSDWNAWPGLQYWDSLTDRVEYQPFWILVFARHPGGAPHAHMIIGNVTREMLDEGLASWPGVDRPGGRPVAKAVWNRWGALHYLFAQADPWEHRRDVWSHCPNLLAPPIESENLEVLYLLTRNQIQRTAGRKGGSQTGRKIGGYVKHHGRHWATLIALARFTLAHGVLSYPERRPA